MNIACTACSARYGVADDKLIGKRVRITCKRCGTVLIVDGNTNPPSVTASTSIAPSPPQAAPPAPEARPAAPAPEPPFTVLFSDGRQEQADVAQIVRFHRSGQLGTDSLVWRDGMSDWVDPWEVEDIAAAFKRMGYSRPAPAPEPPPQAPLHEEFEEEATQIVASSPQHAAPAYEDGGDTNVVLPVRHATSQRVTEEDDEDPTRVGPLDRGSTQVTAAAREAQRARRATSRPPLEARRSEPVAARRSEPARAPEPEPEAPQRAKRTSTRARSARAESERPREDLFARQAHAGSEEEQRVQAAPAAYEDDGPRLTGARNESSVLFSLDSLLKQEQKRPERTAPPARRDESLLVDSGNSLPVGGGIAPALFSAPDFTAPITAPPPAPTTLQPYADDDRSRSSRAWVYVLVLVAFGGGGAVLWRTGALREVLLKALNASPAPAASVPSAPSAAPSSSASEEASAAASVSASASAVASAAASAAPSATSSGGKTAATSSQHGSTATHGSTHEATHEATTHEAPEHEATTHEAPEHEAAATAPASTGASSPFDTAAAKEALTAAAGNAASCKEMGGPTGNGKVSITFAPSGRPTSVAVTGDLAGTTVGSCVARLFRGVHVPAFAGDPVTVAKSFAIE